jgi:preprotein translocase subunit SecE
VSRESRRMEREPDEDRRQVAEQPRPRPAERGRRVGARQFLREVRGELRRVAWPSRRELLSYSLVVLVTVTLLTLYIFGLDQAFGQLVFLIFG